MPARACGFKSHPEYQKADGEEVRAGNAEIAQLVEHDLAKVGVASSSLVFRSKKERNLKCCSSGKAHVQKDASEEADARC